MEVRVLGPVEVDGTPVTGREASVLAALAVRAPHVATVDQLIDDVWGTSPPVTAPKALQNAISRLRRLVDGPLIETVAGGYRLLADVDVHDVERLAAARDAEAALARWRGDAAWVPDGERARLAELRASLEDDAVRARLDRGEVDAAIATLERLVAAEPYREGRWALLVRALAGAGRQADALRAAQRARRVLADDLGLDPGPDLVAAERAVLDVPPPSVRPRRSRPRAATTFVGRAGAVADVRRACEAHRLVTLVGPGGVGKTRLALAALAEVDDVVFVDLAAVRTEHVWEAVAAAANVATDPSRSVADAVVAGLGEALVLLDSCEHVLDAAATVADAVRGAVLATSREPLGLADEVVVPVSPLARDDAVRLFVDRGGAAGSPEDAATLCERLDDLPLAIELAAARAPVLDARQIVDRLDDRFALLDERARRGHARHRALAAMVEWSYDLLADDERLLFDRLSVFRSSFTLEDAEAVVTDERLPIAGVAPALTRLVRASMVSVDADRRFRLLDTFRAYAADRLGDDTRWRRHHLEWIVDLAVAAGPELSGPDQLEWFARVGDRLDDVQEALAWCAEHGPSSAGLTVAGNLFHFWMGRARRAEGLRWLEHFAAAATDVEPIERCRALFGASTIAMLTDLEATQRLGRLATEIAGGDRDAQAIADGILATPPLFRLDLDDAVPFIQRSRPVLDEPQHDGTMPQLWDSRAWLAAARGDGAAARRFMATTLDSLRSMGDEHLYGGFLGYDADFAFASGDVGLAHEIAIEARRIAEDVGCPSCLSSALSALATVDPHADQASRLALLRRAIELAAGINEVLAVEWCLHGFVGAMAEVDPAVAATVAGGLDVLTRQLGHLLVLPGRTQFVTERVAVARRQLGEDRWDELVAAGRRLDYDALVTMALGYDDSNGAAVWVGP